MVFHKNVHTQVYVVLSQFTRSTNGLPTDGQTDRNLAHTVRCIICSRAVKRWQLQMHCNLRPPVALITSRLCSILCQISMQSRQSAAELYRLNHWKFGCRLHVHAGSGILTISRHPGPVIHQCIKFEHNRAMRSSVIDDLTHSLRPIYFHD